MDSVTPTELLNWAGKREGYEYDLARGAAAALTEREQELADANEAVGLPRDASLADLIRHHRNNAALAVGFDQVAAELELAAVTKDRDALWDKLGDTQVSESNLEQELERHDATLRKAWRENVEELRLEYRALVADAERERERLRPVVERLAHDSLEGEHLRELVLDAKDALESAQGAEPQPEEAARRHLRK